ncbi:uncharacterized protein RAG0_06373 [Rhynchosporium agropyri]|uniref:Uncharacterized protein n=1 Tax=Rhynchosporium agropyri TaxID=914238 RepID=A0A1E1KGW1_9HELO|nr:uncharacterized protein RAG0_06373 [Rhynchosporium agropyri]
MNRISCLVILILNVELVSIKYSTELISAMATSSASQAREGIFTPWRYPTKAISINNRSTRSSISGPLISKETPNTTSQAMYNQSKSNENYHLKRNLRELRTLYEY